MGRPCGHQRVVNPYRLFVRGARLLAAAFLLAAACSSGDEGGMGASGGMSKDPETAGRFGPGIKELTRPPEGLDAGGVPARGAGGTMANPRGGQDAGPGPAKGSASGAVKGDPAYLGPFCEGSPRYVIGLATRPAAANPTPEEVRAYCLDRIAQEAADDVAKGAADHGYFQKNCMNASKGFGKTCECASTCPCAG